MPEEAAPGETPEPLPVVAVAVSDVSFMNEPLWLGWKRWTWVRVAFAFVVFVGAFALWRVERNGDEDRQRQDQQAIDSDYDSCVRGNDTRQILRDIVELSVNQSLDLTQVPGFGDLDEATQQFFINLRQISEEASQNGTSFQDQANEVLAERDCEAEFPNHS